MEWWIIAFLILWPLAGLFTWVLVMLNHRKITIGDVLVLPVVVLCGFGSLIVYLCVNADTFDRVLWRW